MSAGALSLRIGSAIYPVKTYADASEMVLAALAKYDGYYRDLPRIDLLNSRGKKCGRVSTNGRVWLGAGDGGGTADVTTASTRAVANSSCGERAVPLGASGRPHNCTLTTPPSGPQDLSAEIDLTIPAHLLRQRA